MTDDRYEVRVDEKLLEDYLSVAEDIYGNGAEGVRDFMEDIAYGEREKQEQLERELERTREELQVERAARDKKNRRVEQLAEQVEPGLISGPSESNSRHSEPATDHDGGGE